LRVKGRPLIRDVKNHDYVAGYKLKTLTFNFNLPVIGVGLVEIT
jgi:hypothetical protein